MYLFIQQFHPSPGHNGVSKTDKSPNSCDAFILLGQKHNDNKLMQFQTL